MLYIVATPIGNLNDITFRAVETLRSADIILCEDTRHSLILLDRYEIKKPLKAFHKFNAAKMLPEILVRLKEDQNVAYISDAGMPGVSDPGAELIRAAIDSNLKYTVIPGACAAVNAAVLSGMCEHGFSFCGFLPEKNSDRTKFLEKFRYAPLPVIFYISPHSLQKDIADIAAVLGNRKAAAVKEMTKIYEKITFFELEQGYPEEIKGEYVLIVEGKEKPNDLNALSVSEHVAYYIDLGMSKNDAIKQTAKDRSVPKNDVYRETFATKND